MLKRRAVLGTFLSVIIGLLLSTPAFAANKPPQTFTLDGRLFKAGSATDPLLDANVNLIIQVLNPAKTCILYEEQQAVNTNTSNGFFNVQVGSNIGSGKRTSDDPGNSMGNVFFNSTTAINGVDNSGSACSYTPTSTDARYFRFFVTPSSTGTTAQLSPDMRLDSVPQALVAETLQGLTPDDVFKTSASSTQAKLDTLLQNTNYNAIADLVSGTSTNYLHNNAEGTNIPTRPNDPATPTAGQMWFDTSTSTLKYFNGSTIEDIGNASGAVTSVGTGAGLTGGPITGTGSISIATGGVTNAMLAGSIDAGKITTGTFAAGLIPTGTDDTKLPLLGGTMAGDLNMGGFNLLGTGHVTMNAQRTITIGRYDAGQQTTLIGSLSGANAGATWFNSTTNRLMYWNGTQALEVSDMTNAGGDITAVTAGTGLTGGGTSGAVTLNVDIGQSIGQFFTIDQVPNCSATHKLQMSLGPTYAWSCEPESGDISAVSTTFPLSGGGTSGALSLTLLYDNTSIGINGSNELEVKDNGITTAKINADAVTTAKILDGNVTPAKLSDSASAGTYTKVTVSTKGLVTSGTTLSATDIPNLDASKITTGTFNAARIPTDTDSTKLRLDGTSTMAGNLNVGTHDITNIGDIAQNAQSTLMIGHYDNAQQGTLVGALSTGDSGKIWYNTTSNSIMYWDGDSAEQLNTTASAVPTSRSINTNTGSGLTGGGNLTADRNLQILVDNASIEIATNTVQVKDGGVTDAKINTVGVQKIASSSGNYFTYRPDGNACTNNQVLKWDNGNSRWICANDNDNTSPTGTASGDLDGTYPGPTVAKIRNVTVAATAPTTTGQVLRYDATGTQWVVSLLDITNIRSSINGTQFLPLNCTNKQTLVWQAGSDTMACTDIAVDDTQLTFGSKSANTVFAAPNGTAGVPTFRSLVANDIPNLDAGKITSGTLPVGRGGTGATTLTGYVKGNGTSAFTASATVPGADVNGNISGNAANVTGIVAIANGGTGQTTQVAAFDALSPMTTLGDIIYGSTAGTGVRLAGNTTATKQFLSQTGTGAVSAAPAWSALAAADIPNLDAAKITTGTLPIARGGTGAGTKTDAFDALSPLTTKGDLIVFNGTDNIRVAVGTNNQVLTADSAQASGVRWATPTTGTVTSVDMTVPSIMSVSGGPITSSGTLAVSLASQTQNTVFAAPNGTNGTPSFRTLASADIPNLDAAKITSGTLPVARGGTGATTLTGYVKGNGTGAFTASSTVATADLSGTVAIANGGTGQSTASAGFNALSPITTLGDILYGNGANSSTRLAGNTTTTKQFLSQTGTGAVSAAPAWSALAAADIPNLDAGKITTGTLPVARGGTGVTSLPGTFVLNGGQAGAVTLGSSDANNVTVNTNGSPRMTILSSGNVGVGTTNPNPSSFLFT